MAAIFYGQAYDVRQIEANALLNQVADCISQGGFLKEEIVSDFNNGNFLEKCNLNFNVEDSFNWREQDQYFIEIEKFGISIGNINLKGQCNQGELSPVCVERKIYSLDNGNNLQEIKILSIVRKTEKNV